MTEEDPALVTRIVVGLNLLRRDIEVLKLAAGLAARRQAPLLALFVEDMNLMNLSALPFAKEVGRISAVERALESPRLERSARAHAERIQRALELLNERLRIEVGFKTVRGHFMPAVYAEAGQVDILFLSRKPEPEAPARRSKPTIAESFPVWTIYDGSPESERALRLALELAEPEPAGLCVALPVESAEQYQALCRRAASFCAGGPAVAAPGRLPRFFRAEPTDGTKLLRRLRQTGCRLLVIARGDSQWLGTLTDTAECPMVLI